MASHSELTIAKGGNSGFQKLVKQDAPDNFLWCYSLGGREDHLIDLAHERHADVFPDVVTLRRRMQPAHRVEDGVRTASIPVPHLLHPEPTHCQSLCHVSSMPTPLTSRTSRRRSADEVGMSQVTALYEHHEQSIRQPENSSAKGARHSAVCSALGTRRSRRRRCVPRRYLRQSTDWILG
ncbi:hypothetical protein RLT57_32035 (plasmid) [Streptomyces sp. ITFR-21]|nr:hypothetical protein [Streptomyces sp. ITFR-21]WNI20170.1 hypothetical protein RLT57_32035 [Streptomyces sp. ITFR-21]